jgi:hypothetical protein
MYLEVWCTSLYYVECPGSPSSGSVLPGRECLAETTVFVRETGSLSPVLNSLSSFQDLTGERKILKILEPFLPRGSTFCASFSTINLVSAQNHPIWLIVDVSSQTKAAYKLQEEVQCFNSMLLWHFPSTASIKHEICYF